MHYVYFISVAQRLHTYFFDGFVIIQYVPTETIKTKYMIEAALIPKIKIEKQEKIKRAKPPISFFTILISLLHELQWSQSIAIYFF